MTATDPAALSSIVDRLDDLVPLQTRGFFGGTGLVCDGVQFAMVMGTTVYFVVDEATRPRYQAAEAEPFTYQTARGPVTVSRYHALPQHVLDDPDALPAWVDDAIQAAKTAPTGSRRRTTRRPGPELPWRS